MYQQKIDKFIDGTNQSKKPYSIDILKQKISNLPWKKGEYAKQSWKNWLHSIAPYVGKITPSFAHWLIELTTKKGEMIFDPFCGSGTIPLEADLMGRKSLGIDINPYAIAISKAKFDRAPLKERLNWINSIELITDKISLDDIDDYAKQYYHPQTLREIIYLRDEMIKDNQFFLLGCLLGISHGHRKIHLSGETGYIIPYLKNGMNPIYKNVKNKLMEKIKRIYKKSPIPLITNGEIIQGDIRDINLSNKFADVIITSPPYYETLNYVDSNILRLILLGISFEKQEKIANETIQHRATYLMEMKKVGLKLKSFLKDNGLCIFVLGDVKRGKKIINTAEDISNLFEEIGYETLFIVEDKIPKEKSIIGKFKGEEALSNNTEKSDRILVMKIKD